MTGGVAVSNGRKPFQPLTQNNNLRAPPQDAKHQQQLQVKQIIKSSSSSSEAEEKENIVIQEIRKSRDDPNVTSLHEYKRGVLLGKGGFAKVYKCTSLDTKKYYAIKIIPKSNLVKTRARQKLQSEIRIHRSLKHANICEFKHFFEDSSCCYLLLSLCHNQSCNELIKRRKCLTEPEVLYYIQQIIHGVKFMHSNLVIHRDLKLGNLFLSVDMKIQIGDLGLAAHLSSETEMRKTICGTPNYIAPEIIDGNNKTVGHSFGVDLWSIGVIAFAFIVGKPPFESKDVKSTYKRILDNCYAFPSERKISEGLKSLIQSILQTKPDNRLPLDQMLTHRVFTSSQSLIPHSLPDRSLRETPDWDSHFYASHLSSGSVAAGIDHDKENNNYNLRRQKSSSSSINKPSFSYGRSSSSSRMLSFTEKVAKVVKATDVTATSSNYYEGRDDMSSAPRSSSSSSSRFNVYNDEQQRDDNRRDQPERLRSTSRTTSSTASLRYSSNSSSNSSNAAVDELARRASAISLNSNKPSLQLRTRSSSMSSTGSLRMSPSIASASSTVSCSMKKNTTAGSSVVVDNDMKALEDMHYRLERLDLASDSVSKQMFPATSPPLPFNSASVAKTWVNKYVDYTSKYGLGFSLNDGSTGVCFNDSTKAVLSADEKVFWYIQRVSSKDGKGSAESRPYEAKKFSLDNYPKMIEKKVLLLKHFKSYLSEQGSGNDQKKLEAPIIKSNNETSSMVYIKKWVRTRHAILFRLSDRTVQVVFFDHTEVILSSGAKLVTYVNKAGVRETMDLNSIGSTGESGHTEISKRLRYAKDILNQLISTSKR